LWLLPGGGLDETEWQSKADKIMSKYIKKGEEAAKRGSSGTAADWVELLYVDYRGKYGVDPRSVGSGGAGLLSPPLPLAAAAPPAATPALDLVPAAAVAAVVADAGSSSSLAESQDVQDAWAYLDDLTGL